MRFHFYKYPPLTGTAAWGYATGLKADTALRPAAWATAPIAFAWGCLKARQVAAKYGATVLHAHWVIPNGVIAAAAARGLPFVVSLHGSDVFVAERSGVAGRSAKYAFDRAGWITACSDDLRERGIKLGARETSIDTVPYGVDSERFAPSTEVRAAVRRELGIGDSPFIFTGGRLVRKQGCEYLIDAAAALGVCRTCALESRAAAPSGRTQRARRAAGDRVILLGNRSQDGSLAYAQPPTSSSCLPSDAGNVGGLPNFALEALASRRR